MSPTDKPQRNDERKVAFTPLHRYGEHVRRTGASYVYIIVKVWRTGSDFKLFKKFAPVSRTSASYEYTLAPVRHKSYMYAIHLRRTGAKV